MATEGYEDDKEMSKDWNKGWDEGYRMSRMSMFETVAKTIFWTTLVVVVILILVMPKNRTDEYGQEICNLQYGDNETVYAGYDKDNRYVKCVDKAANRWDIRETRIRVEE
jgi:hypothetical protein